MVNSIWKHLRTHPVKRYTKRSLGKVKYIVVHHSASKTGSPGIFAKWHVKENDWPGIGYHYVVNPDGKTHNTNPIDVRSYHVKDNNTRCIGICLVGNFEKTEPTAAQIESLGRLIRSLQIVVPGIKVKGHRDFKATSCPGENLYAYIKAWYP